METERWTDRKEEGYRLQAKRPVEMFDLLTEFQLNNCRAMGEKIRCFTEGLAGRGIAFRNGQLNSEITHPPIDFGEI